MSHSLTASFHLCPVCEDYDCKSVLTPAKKQKISLCNNSASNSLFFSSLMGFCCKGVFFLPCFETDKRLSALLSMFECLPACLSLFCFHRNSPGSMTLPVSVCILSDLSVRLLLFVSFIKNLKSLPYKLKQVHFWFHAYFHSRHPTPFTPSSHVFLPHL